MASGRKVRAGRAFVEFFLEDGRLQRGLKMTQRRLKRFSASVGSMGRSFLTLGASAAAAFAYPVAKFAQFDDAIRATKAVTNATEAEMQLLNDTARELGRTTSFTAGEVANLMTELGRAGFNPAEIVNMTDSVLALSRATGVEAPQAAGIMAATLRQFSMGATDAARVADVLTTAANSTFNTVDQLGESLAYAGPVANDLGLSLEDTVAILGTLGNVGIQGTNAGTALRRLGTISAAQSEKLRQLFGVEFVDAAGNVTPLIQSLGELGRATENLPTGERAAKFNQAFGLLGITASSVLANAAGDTEELSAKLESAAGNAQKTAEEMDAGIGGAWRRLQSAIEGVTLSVGDSLAPVLTAIAEDLSSVAANVTEFIKRNAGLVKSLLYLTGVAIGAGVALLAIGTALKVVALAIGILSAALALALNPWFLVIAAIAAFIVYITDAHKAVAGFVRDALAAFGPVWDAIVGRLKSGDFAGAMRVAWEAAKIAWDIGLTKLRQAWEHFLAWMKTTAIDAVQKIPLIDRLLGGDNRQARANARRRVVNNLANADRQRDQQIAAAQRRLQQLVADANAEDEKRRKAEEEAAARKRAEENRDAIPPKQKRIVQEIVRGSQVADTVSATTADAVAVQSIEGQKLILQALGFKTKEDAQVEAIASLEDTLIDEFEQTRRENRNRPQVISTRKA
jgi:TP901 family phage tail tape measure protein